MTSDRDVGSNPGSITYNLIGVALCKLVTSLKLCIFICRAEFGGKHLGLAIQRIFHGLIEKQDMDLGWPGQGQDISFSVDIMSTGRQ